MYSHGLEKIYAFENINPKSVKTVSGKEPKKLEPTPETPSHHIEQLTLELGPCHQEALPSFRLKEPVSSIGLSAFALKALVAKNIHTCEEACIFVRDGLHKSLGQSHTEELEAKLETYMGKTPFRLQKTVDLQSLVRISCSPLEPKVRFCLLSRYHLQELAGATSIEQQEVLRLPPEQISKIIDQAQELLLNSQGQFIESSLTAIMQAYIMPWLKYRAGFLPDSEILERLFQISCNKELFWQTIEFLRLFGDPIKLTFVQEGIYASNESVMYDYLDVVDCAKSYFYLPHTSYPRVLLEQLITKELAKKGIGLEQGFIYKVLTDSPDFMINSQGHIFLNSNYGDKCSH